MAENKNIRFDYYEKGLSLYCIVRKEINQYILDVTDGIFKSSPINPYFTMTENAIIKGLYEINEARTLWEDGNYHVTVFQILGASPNPATDDKIGEGDIFITNDYIRYRLWNMPI
ncbi:MAG: hypothetical protein GX869_07605 [Candidatus Cloacimonetes bacterium]|nr:hypothetical protein [Candidatus Cloacimonadota bacterium]